MTKTLSSGKQAPHRVRNELKFRTLAVSDKQLVAEQFWRITFHSQALEDFTSPGTDDHIKLFFPEKSATAPVIPTVTDEGIIWPDNQRPESRDYTPLEFDGKGALVIDFYQHLHSPPIHWQHPVHVGKNR